MFFLDWLWGWIIRTCWRFGFMVSGTAPTLKTAYWTTGWFGYRFKCWRRSYKGGAK